jgi:hypothetical protein
MSAPSCLKDGGAQILATPRKKAHRQDFWP